MYLTSFLQPMKMQKKANFRTGNSVLHQVSDKREKRDVEERDEMKKRRTMNRLQSVPR